MRLNRAFSFWPGLLVAVASLAAAASAPWGPFRAWKVRRTVGIPAPDKKQPDLPGADCCTVSFPTAGFLKPNGSDVRVAVAGEPVPFRIVDIAYGGVVRLVAAVPGQAERMHVYYGNPEAPAVSSDWTPRRGLWLETRRYQGGECNTLQAMRQAWAKAEGHRDGAGPVARVFHGHNPFGPADNYMSRYRGYFYLPKDTTVRFAVGADDIGYVLVEGRQVASKRSWGAMNRRKRYTDEPLRLRAGLHPIEVFHVEKRGKQQIAVAWWMPGMKQGKKYKHYQVMPASAFAPLRYGRLLNYEVQGQAIGVDFASVNAGDVPLDVPHLGERLLVRYEFRDRSRPANRALQCSARWDFGDRTTSTSRDPNHVFLRQGDYTVGLTLSHGGTSWKTAQAIRVGPGYHRAARRQWDRLENYYPILKDYQFDQMTTEDLMVAARVFEELEKPEEIIATCRVLYDRRKDLKAPVLVRHCLLLGRHLREDKGEEGDQGEANARKAIEVFAYAEKHTDDVRAKARLANEAGDVYYYFLGDLERAQAEYTKTLTDYVKAADEQVRLAQIRLGDIYRTKGDAAAARKAYERAADMPIADYSNLVAKARRGSFARTVEDYLRRDMCDEALQAINDWEWEFPTAKLEGYSSLLRAKVAATQDNQEEALKQCNELLQVNPDSEYADDILLFLGGIHQKANRLDKALEAVTRLLDDYPASDLQERARLQRVSIRLAQGKHAQAEAEALQLARAREDSENAPKALLLAARAQIAQKKRADALATLERLAEKHGDSEEAEQARRMLQELRRP